MTRPDPLKAYFDASEVPRVDVSFRTAVMEKVAQRRFALDMMVRAVIILGVGLGAYLFQPAIESLLQDILGLPLEVYGAFALSGLLAVAGHYLATHRIGLSLPFARFLF